MDYTNFLPRPPSASWHADYRDTAFVYFGGLDPSLSEGDIITIFSQYGEPTHIRLIRDKDTGKSKGFGFLKYEDQRSTDLAVDNLSGSVIVKGGMQLRVEHARYEKRKREGEDEEEMDNVRWDKVLGVDKAADGKDEMGDESPSDSDRRKERKKRRLLLKEERELKELMDKEDDEEDPMKEYLINEKKAEVERALARTNNKGDKKHRHRHRRRERDRESPDEERSHHHRRHRHDSEDASDSRERRHGSNKRRDSRDRRRSRDRNSDSGSWPRHARNDRDQYRYRSRSRERRR